MRALELTEEARFVRRGDRQLYTFVHHALPRTTGERRAVVVCPPFGPELANAQRVLVHLCRRMAERGWSACRLDYFGTGESEGDLPDCSVGSCVDSILAALDELRETLAATTYVLVGVRLGALLASLAAERAPAIHALVLIDPVLEGSAYVKELRLSAAIGARKDGSSGDGGRPRAGDALDVGGYRFAAEFLDEIATTSVSPSPSTVRTSLLFTTLSLPRGVDGRDARIVACEVPRFWSKRDQFRSMALEAAVLASLEALDERGIHA